MSKHANRLTKHRTSTLQQGSALIIALVFLLIMTLIGTAAMQNTGQQESMAGSVRDRNLGFQAAETGLRICLRMVEPPVALPPAGMIAPVESGDPGGFWTNYFQQNSSLYSTGTTTPPTGTSALSQVSQQPSCIIENMNNTNLACLSDPNLNCFRITARGVGGTANAIVILQSMYYR